MIRSKRALLCLAAFVLTACAGGATPEAAWTCQLTRVIDGDTLHARCDGEKDKMKVRLLRIDTPE